MDKLKIKETVLANKVALGPSDAMKIIGESSRLWIAKGKKVVFVDLKKNEMEEEEMLALIIGRSGKLRAPTIRAGKRMLVGFNRDAYTDIFG